MQAKLKEREKAIELRRQGFSYREILEQIPVAKSSLSLWLRSVKLAKRQKQRLTEKRLAAVIRGGAAKREKRIALTKEIKDEARSQIGKLSKRELWLIGISLYWAEGNKEKNHKPGSGTVFSNSDANMIRLYLKWLLNSIKLPKEKIYFVIYIHKNNEHRLNEVKDYWYKKTRFDREHFGSIYFKRNKINTKRKNIGNNYFGQLRIKVLSRSILNRRIQGWIEGICY